MPERSFETEILINASANRVWNIISDVGSYADWNPFVTSVTGTFEVGRRVRVVTKPPKGPAFTFRPYVVELERPKELAWHGRFFFDPVFSGHHYMRIEPQGEGVVKFIHGERFGGALVPLLWRSLNSNTRAGFEAMNEAVKKLAEG